MFEKEVAGIYFSGHILDSYSKHISKISPVKIIDITGNEEKEGMKRS